MPINLIVNKEFEGIKGQTSTEAATLIALLNSFIPDKHHSGVLF